MNDERYEEIERLFDGELPEADRLRLREELAVDLEGLRHLDRLAALRALARRHDPASNIPRREFALPSGRRRLPWWLAVAATAAAVALLARTRGPEMGVIKVVEVKPPGEGASLLPGPSVGRPTGPVDRPPLEVELYRWANTPSRAPGQAARLVLSPPPPSRKRSPADEILALELANSGSQTRGNVRRFAVSRGPKPAPARSTSPVPRPRGTHPEV